MIQNVAVPTQKMIQNVADHDTWCSRSQKNNLCKSLKYNVLRTKKQNRIAIE